MIAMALIHLCFGGDSPLGYVTNKVLLFFSATTALSSTMIRLNRTTIWKNFSQHISQHMLWKSDPLNILSTIFHPRLEFSV